MGGIDLKDGVSGIGHWISYIYGQHSVVNLYHLSFIFGVYVVNHHRQIATGHLKP